MAADPLIYCLKELTDYEQFERLCHDLMAREGYPDLEPFGGFKDKGRDAIEVSSNGKRTTIFAYSVREDWLKKLKEDAAKVKKHGHTCTHFVFLVTEKVTPTQRDNTKKLIEKQYGWKLKIYHLEWLRRLLAKNHDLLSQHPQIFTPSLIQGFTARFDKKNSDHLFVSYAKEDEALATWLTRKLTAEGYKVWCQHLTLLGEDEYPADIDEAIRTRTFRMLALLSKASLIDQEANLQRAAAHSLADERKQETLIPLDVEELDPRQVDRRTARLTSIPFHGSWAEGLASLLKKLRSIDCPKALSDGKAIAASSFLGEDLLGGPETIYSNCLPVEHVPSVVYRFTSQQPITREEAKTLGIQWAFRQATDTSFLAFHKPPGELAAEHGFKSAGVYSWRDLRDVEGINSRNLVSELIRKSLLVRCEERGLTLCTSSWLRYFASNLVEGDRLWYVQPDGKRNYVGSAGQRKYRTSEEYKYHLAPVFYVRRDMGPEFVALVKIRVKLSDTSGAPLDRKKIPSRRKHLCKFWFNEDWLNRTLAVCQYLADGSELISIGGYGEEMLTIAATPLHWTVPVSIDEIAIGAAIYEPVDFADDDDEWDDEGLESPESKGVANG